jgi:hypothetical protein
MTYGRAPVDLPLLRVERVAQSVAHQIDSADEDER